MIAAQIVAPGQTSVLEIPEPELGPDDVLIEVKRAGICGTDLHILHGSYAFAKLPLVPGHEFCGTVVQLGSSVKRFKLGDRVTADPNLPCGSCSACQRNAQNQCVDLQAVGVTRNGAFAKYVAVPSSSVFTIGDMPFAEAALIEPLACVVWGLKRVQVQPGDRVLMFGAGPMGCLMLQALLQNGASEVLAVDRSPLRLELAASLGAKTLQADQLSASLKNSFDIVADVTGVPAVIETTLHYVRPGGKVWIFGVAPEDARVSFSPYDVFKKDLSIIGSFALRKTFPETLALIQTGKIKLAPLISHVFPLPDFARALHTAEHDKARMKIQLEL